MGNAASTRAYASFVIALILFGSNGIVASAITLPSFQIVYLRTGLGALALVIVLLASRRKLAAATHRRDLAYVVLSGLCMGIGWLFLYEAFQRIGVGLSSLVYYCGPIIVMAASPVLFGEKLTTVKVACFGIVLAGLVLVNGMAADVALDFSGLALAAGSALSLAGLVVFNKKGAAITGLENSAWQLCAAFSAVAVYTVLTSGTPLVQVPAGQMGYVLFLGLVNTGLGCYLYFGVFDALPTQTVASLGYLEPLTAVILGVAILGEPMSALQAAGAAMIIGGAVACELVKSRPAKLRPAFVGHSPMAKPLA